MPKKRKRKSKNLIEGDDFINDGDEYDDPSPGTSESKPAAPLAATKTVHINITNYKSDKYSNFKYDKDGKKESDKEGPEKEKPKKEKPKSKSKAMPPPMSFEELLKIAKKKQTEPQPQIREDLIKEKAKKKDDGRPLTALEKKELEDEKRRKLKKMGKLLPENKEEDKTKGAPDQEKGRFNGEKNSAKQEESSKLKQALEKPKPEQKVIDRTKYFAIPAAQKARDQHVGSRALQSSKYSSPKIASRDLPQKEMKPPKSRNFPPPQDRPSKPQKHPMQKKVERFPPPDMRRKPSLNPASRRRIESDSEEERDSDMDDFIDDGEDEMDFSSEIGKMFGYDRNKYR